MWGGVRGPRERGRRVGREGEILGAKEGPERRGGRRGRRGPRGGRGGGERRKPRGKETRRRREGRRRKGEVRRGVSDGEGRGGSDSKNADRRPFRPAWRAAPSARAARSSVRARLWFDFAPHAAEREKNRTVARLETTGVSDELPGAADYRCLGIVSLSFVVHGGPSCFVSKSGQPRALGDKTMAK
jgi:ribonuclease E